MSAPPERLTDGQAFGRYQIVRLLGEGGMGAVYEALHVGLKKRVALKTLLPSIARNPEAQTRFLREGEAASRINHPNVVDVTDVGSEGGTPYLVMEYLEGETLGDFIDRKGPLPVGVAVDLLLPCIAAVAAGHDRDVIHRDLKPQNVFLARGPWGEPIPKILDFGVSKILDGQSAALTGTMAVLGTASYMSPEQARGAKVVDAASDQYAIGLIFFEMLTATRAHDGEHPLEVLHRISSGVVPDIRRWRSDLPPEIEAVLAQMLAMNPGARFSSLRAAARALLPYASEKARVTFADAFDGPDVARAGVAPSLSTPGLRPGSSGGAAQSGGTRLLPKASSAEPTTLGQSAIESRLPARRRSRRPLALLVGGLVAAAVGVGFFVQSKATQEVAVEPSAHEAPALAGAAAELPHAPPPPPVTPPPVVQVQQVQAPPPNPAVGASAAAPSATSKHRDAEAAGASASDKPHGHSKKHAAPAAPKVKRGDSEAPIID